MAWDGSMEEPLLRGEHYGAWRVCDLLLGRGVGEQMGLVAEHIKRDSLALAFPVQEMRGNAKFPYKEGQARSHEITAGQRAGEGLQGILAGEVELGGAAAMLEQHEVPLASCGVGEATRRWGLRMWEGQSPLHPSLGGIIGLPAPGESWRKAARLCPASASMAPLLCASSLGCLLCCCFERGDSDMPELVCGTSAQPS